MASTRMQLCVCIEECTLSHIFSSNLAGVFAMSTFLPSGSTLPDRLKQHTLDGGTLPPLLYFHGSDDTLIRLKWAEDTKPRLEAANSLLQWHVWQVSTQGTCPWSCQRCLFFVSSIRDRSLW